MSFETYKEVFFGWMNDAAVGIIISILGDTFSDTLEIVDEDKDCTSRDLQIEKINKAFEKKKINLKCGCTFVDSEAYGNDLYPNEDFYLYLEKGECNDHDCCLEVVEFSLDKFKLLESQYNKLAKKYPGIKSNKPSVWSISGMIFMG